MKRPAKASYSFMPDIEYIKETMNLSTFDKLKWLEEANNFVRKFVSGDKLRIWEKIRSGEIKI